MVIRILVVILILGITACAVGVTPLHETRMPNAEKASVVDETTGSYCFCSLEETLDHASTHVGKTMSVGGIDISRLAKASIISIEPTAKPSEGITISYTPNDSTEESVVFDSSTGGCFIIGRKISCQRPVFKGAVLGIGWSSDTTDFHVNRAGTLHITDVSSECGLGLLIIPFCESAKHTLKMQPLASDNSCRCEQ